MGAALRLPIEGPLHREVLENKHFFSTVTAASRSSSGDGPRPKVQTGDSESEVRLEKEGAFTVATFTYSFDNDSDPSNGRIYLKDRFVFDPRQKKLHHAERNFFLKSDSVDGYLENLNDRLKQREPPLSADPRGLNRFFENVVLKIPDFSFETSDLPPAFLKPVLRRPSILPNFSRTPRNNLLALRRPLLSSLSPAQRTQGRVDLLIDRFMEGLGSPILFGSLLTGGAAFHWAEGAVLSRWGGLGLRSAILATGAGVALEAPVFRLTERSLSRAFFRKDPDGSSDVLAIFLSFTALRGAGLAVRFSLAGLPESALLYGKVTYPILHHGASFGALHGIHEVERLRRPAEGPWASRGLEDGVFYLQAGLASHLAQGALGPRFSQQTMELRRAEELRSHMENVPQSHWTELREKAQREKIEDWENRFHRMRERAEATLEEAEAQGREILLIRGALTEASERAKDYYEQFQSAEARLKRNKLGTEKVIEWARLKEKENSGIRAGLEDALGQIEAMSAEGAKLKADLEEMTAEFVRRDHEATRAEESLIDWEAKARDWER